MTSNGRNIYNEDGKQYIYNSFFTDIFVSPYVYKLIISNMLPRMYVYMCIQYFPAARCKFPSAKHWTLYCIYIWPLGRLRDSMHNLDKLETMYIYE